MAIKYKFLNAATKRWAFPIALVLLPGGFVVLAFALFYKIVLPKRSAAADVTAAEPVPVAVVGSFVAAMRMYSARARYEFTFPRERQQDWKTWSVDRIDGAVQAAAQVIRAQ